MITNAIWTDISIFGTVLDLTRPHSPIAYRWANPGFSTHYSGLVLLCSNISQLELLYMFVHVYFLRTSSCSLSDIASSYAVLIVSTVYLAAVSQSMIALTVFGPLLDWICQSRQIWAKKKPDSEWSGQKPWIFFGKRSTFRIKNPTAEIRHSMRMLGVLLFFHSNCDQNKTKNPPTWLKAS